MATEIDKSIYKHPQVQRSMVRIRQRYETEREELTLWLRTPWEPGQEPILFSTEANLEGCVAIYDPVDGELL